MKKIKVLGNYAPSELLTTQVVDEDGEVMYCDHAGAQPEEMEFQAYSWWDDAHTYVPDDSTFETVMVCDKENCRAWQDLDGVWRND